MDPRSTPGTPPQPDHIGLGRRFVQKHQGTGHPRLPFLPPGRPGLLQVFPILLAGAERLFLCVRFSAARA